MSSNKPLYQQWVTPTCCYSDTQHLRLHLLALTLTFTVPHCSTTSSPSQKQQEYRIATVLSIFWIKKVGNTKVHYWHTLQKLEEKTSMYTYMRHSKSALCLFNFSTHGCVFALSTGRQWKVCTHNEIDIATKCLMIITADVCQVLSQCKVPLVWINVHWVVV